MKVYTTELINDVVTLTTYKSIKEFLAINSWIDERFIFVATTKDLSSYEFADEWNGRGLGLVYSDLEKKSGMMLRDIYLNV